MSKQHEWRPGQRVCAYGYGVGTLQMIEGGTYPLKVAFDSGVGKSFTLDGKYDVEQIHPTLFPLDEKPQKPRTKMLYEGWFNLYRDSTTQRPIISVFRHPSKEDALNSRFGNMKYYGDPIHVAHEWEE